jgi:hypothetical protein
MKMRTAMVGLVLIAPLSVAWGAKAVDPETMTKVPCSDLHFSKAFLQKYPQAPNACIEGRQDKSGAKYGKFHAKIYLNSSDRTTVQLLDAKGDTKTTFSFKPKPGSTITVNGKKTRVQDLSPGDELDFWIPETRMTAGSLPAPTWQSWTVLPPLEAPK